MIVLSNTVAQTLAPGQAMIFDTEVLHTGCAECHRNNSGAVVFRANDAIYECKFSGNIGSTEAGDAQIALVVNGAPLPETTMVSTTAAAGDIDNVACDTAVKTCCGTGGESMTVVNTGTTTVNVGANPCLFIKRVA